MGFGYGGRRLGGDVSGVLVDGRGTTWEGEDREDDVDGGDGQRKEKIQNRTTNPTCLGWWVIRRSPSPRDLSPISQALTRTHARKKF
ncbi:hypothetical protein KFK09_028836 [Dendrobium nobile]|uniref:Uncharacterized protein n=1 Tax=Dendrobium nobile TaxID=94219 RepID=A0A8T3A2P5_DENNO|nr:hypothetical protein KFK09_028836 [Dendrobium nobile]